MDNHRKIIKENRVRLVESLDLMSTSLLDRLVQEDVISQEQLMSIKERNTTNIQQASALLDKLVWKTYDVWLKFLDCASKYDFGSIIRDLSVEHQLKCLQRPVSEAILSHFNTTEIWQGDDNFIPFVLDKVFVDPVLTKEWWDSATCEEGVKMESYVDIIQQLSNSKTVFVFGETGTGKSTLSRKLCCDWAKLQDEDAMDIEDTNFHNFSFILPISFLEVKENQNFQQYVSDTYELKRYAMKLCNYIKDHQESVLLICDEIENYREETSVEMTNLLHRRLFPEVKMIIKSRSPSLPFFCNDSYLPFKTLSLQEFSDDGVKQYARKLYKTRANTLLPYYLERRRHTSQYIAFLPMILRIILKEIQNNKYVHDTEYCIEYVAYTIRRAQRKWKGLVTPEASNEQILKEHRELIVSLGQLAKENVKPEKMETKFSPELVRDYQKQSGRLMFEFLIEHKENRETVYMFSHKILQEFFLSFFLINCHESDLEDTLLQFCNCRPAFDGSRVKDILEGFNSSLATNIRTISSGNETEMAALNTELHLHYFYRHKSVSVNFPQVMTISTYIVSKDFDWNSYLAMDGWSKLVKLTLMAQESFLSLLKLLNAPRLTSFTLRLAGSHHSFKTENYEQIEEVLNGFPLKTLKIEKSESYIHQYVKSAAVAAACKLSGVEELIFSRVSLARGQTYQLNQRLQESVLKTLVISNCELHTEQLLELIDAVSRSTSLESLDISGNWIYGDANQLVDVAEKFSKLRKLNLTGNSLSEDMKQIIKDKLKMYPQLEVKI